MFTVPSRHTLCFYGPKMINIEAEPVYADEYALLPTLREYMMGMMRQHHGIGMAAPQVGVSRRFFLIATEDGDYIDLVNPEIKELYGIANTEFEACLSIPPGGNGCPVERCDHVEIEYSTSTSEERIVRKFSFMDSRVAQHEFDHLTGTFFIDRVHATWKKKVLDLFYTWKGKQECSVISQSIPRLSPVSSLVTHAGIS
jgi:peptide deformylase